MGHALDPEQLLRQDRFLKALARSLVVDPNRADDLAQQAWLAALTHESPGSVFAWLATVVRRVAFRARREDARREARERAAARAEAAPSDAAILEREDTRRAVVAAVLRLEEPYRTTIVLRFLEGLPPRTVARRMRAPVATVRTRVRRGLEQLRADLDRSHGGDRAPWLLALAPLALPAPSPMPALASSLAGVLAMTTKTKLLAVAAAGVVLALSLWTLASATGSFGAGQGVAPLADASRAASRPTEAASREPVGAAESRAGTATRATTGTLLVQALWADGTPAPDLLVALAAADAAWEAAVVERQLRTDMSGVALFEALLPGRVRAYLDRGVSRGADIVAGQRKEIVLRPSKAASMNGTDPRDVAGVVVDEHDVPVAGADVLVSLGMDASSLQVVAARSADDGTFALRDVNGSALIAARAPGHAASRCDATLFRVLAADDRAAAVRVKLVLGGLAGIVAGTVRDARGAPVARATVQVGRDVLGAVITTGNPPHPVLARTDALGRFTCEGVPAGTSPIVVRAPGFGAFGGTADVVEGRESVLQVDLEPAVTLRGVVRGPDGQPLEGAWIGLRTEGRTSASAGTNTGPDGAYVLRGLPAGELEVEVESHGHGKKRMRFPAAAGETLTWDVAFGDGPALHGRVIDERGQPLAAVVCARAPLGSGVNERETSTGADGSFRIIGWVDQQTRLIVRLSGWDIARLEGVRPDQEVVVTVRDTDRPSAFLTGTIVGPDGRPFARAALSLLLDDGSARSVRTPIDAATGGFRIGPLPPGLFALRVEPRDHGPMRTSARRLAPGETLDLGALRLEQPGFVAGTCTWREGTKPCEMHWVLQDARGEWIGIVVAGPNSIEPTPFAPGKYTLLIRGDGVASSLRELTVRAGATTRLEVDVRPGRNLKIAVTAATDDPKALLRLQVRDASSALVWSVPGLKAWRKPGLFDVSMALAPGSYRADAQCGESVRTFDLAVVADEDPLQVEWVVK